MATVTVFARSSNVTAPPRARATAASGTNGSPSRRYGAMGSVMVPSAAAADLRPTVSTRAASPRRREIVPRATSTVIRSARARANGSSGTTTLPATTVAGREAEIRLPSITTTTAAVTPEPRCAA